MTDQALKVLAISSISTWSMSQFAFGKKLQLHGIFCKKGLMERLLSALAGAILFSGVE